MRNSPKQALILDLGAAILITVSPAASARAAARRGFTPICIQMDRMAADPSPAARRTISGTASGRRKMFATSTGFGHLRQARLDLDHPTSFLPACPGFTGITR